MNKIELDVKKECDIVYMVKNSYLIYGYFLR